VEWHGMEAVDFGLTLPEPNNNKPKEPKNIKKETENNSVRPEKGT
jgi:hypothetical protein